MAFYKYLCFSLTAWELFMGYLLYLNANWKHSSEQLQLILMLLAAAESLCVVSGSEFENSIAEKHLPVIESDHKTKYECKHRIA